MSKESIEWHEECYKNSKRTLDEIRMQLQSIQKKYTESLTGVLFYELQIKEAKKFGKDGFDSERFMLKHKKLPNIKNNIRIEIELEKYKSRSGGDVGNLECDFCERGCQHVGETWYEGVIGDRAVSFCPSCVKILGGQG